MRKILTACVLLLLTLTACPQIPLPDGETKRPLDNVELQYPNVTFVFSPGKEYGSGAVFPAPKTIDCSKLTLNTNAFKNAIEAGALVVRIQTPPKITHIVKNEQGQNVKNEKGQDVTEVVTIKPVYGGVLALCTVSDRAKGPDARSYRIRGLDDYLVKGRDGLISVVGAVLEVDKPPPNPFEDLIRRRTGGASPGVASTHYSWILWLTDRTATFTDYEAEVSKRRAQ